MYRNIHDIVSKAIERNTAVFVQNVSNDIADKLRIGNDNPSYRKRDTVDDILAKLKGPDNVTEMLAGRSDSSKNSVTYPKSRL